MPARGTRRAFSLLELLLTIALVGVLAAILFPVFSSIRERGASSACLSNLRHYGSAIMAYAAEHDGLPYWNGTVDRSDGSVALQYYQWLRRGGYLPDPDIARNRRTSQLHCPLATSRELTNPYGFHYAGNGALSNYYPRLRGIPVPISRVILAAESFDQDGFWTATHLNTTLRGAPGANPPRRGQFHGSKAQPGMHCFFLDGHVRLVSPAGGDWGNAPTFGSATNGGYFYTSGHFSQMKEGRLEAR